MDLDIRIPLEPNFLPNTIAEIVATGGIRYSDFLTDSETEWTVTTQYSFPLRHTLATVPSAWAAWTRARTTVAIRSGATWAVANPTSKTSISLPLRPAATTSTPVVFTRRRNRVAVSTNLQKARNVNFAITRMMNGEFSLPSTRSIRLQSYDLSESLVIAAYALRTRISTYNAPENGADNLQITQHGPTVLTAIISLARASDGARVDVHGFLTQLSARATRVTYGIYTKRPGRDPPAQAITLQSFASEGGREGRGGGANAQVSDAGFRRAVICDAVTVRIGEMDAATRV
ncbi:uncharacterized protein MYCFIDRAFT_177610 [Pseudocercospora fijiensis CIRAD86]|uniref:Uncharacterized protein n=1 Tax=Pseudocercospora fijiensis (strain CIRAD86) TaxID=383855 RepID=M3AU64_PSEFD|nr:uncharacterized protein MYCFIDRAFT_177610 [Pseudocercospora fijiensis CIRAD86]EME80678.1 hypothetical protein MYCFIDRAFT_177610 [Pseudocercospora fijiensis CIRAD86]